jgi:flagellar biosynthesis/type III secretory pathway chaperone
MLARLVSIPLEVAGLIASLPQLLRRLARLPETMETLGTGLEALAELLERLLASLDRLDERRIAAGRRAAARPDSRAAAGIAASWGSYRSEVKFQSQVVL